MYVVMLYECYVGSHFDENTKIFIDKEKAENYALLLNSTLAANSHCLIADLGDYYEVEWVPLDKE